jgi:UDP-N-acetylmuramoylalanine--D-glutamate ligase
MRSWQSKNVLILGAARQGIATLRYLIKKGANVTVNDQRPAVDFQQLKQEFSNQTVHWEFSGHPLFLLENTEIVIVSGGVPLELPIILEAYKRGITITNDSQIFMEAVKARVIGITGSAGKTTTTILVGEIAKAAALPDQKVWVGGNIGYPLIDHLDEIKANDLVIIELSSFQLEKMNYSPQIAAVLNITPNHLDRHINMQVYINAKSQILRHQTGSDSAILNCEDKNTMGLRELVKGRLITFGLTKLIDGFKGTILSGKNLVFQSSKKKIDIMPRSEIQLKGEHNLVNALAASAIGFAAKFPLQAIRNGIRQVKGIPHRLEFIREWRGTFWYNDSIATAPERTMAAIRSFDQPLILLLGGRDKKLPWDDLVNLIHQRVKHVVLFGESAELISRALGKVRSDQYPLIIGRSDTLENAVFNAAENAEKGDVIVLSPGCTSFDEFCDFEARGQCFIGSVKALP